MAKRITTAGLLIALAMILSYLELLIPFNFGIPGVKLGLANLVVVSALYLFGARQAFAISIVRIMLVSVTFGNMAALLYSIAGGLLSYLVMLLISRIKGFSIIGTSVAGGVTHNIGQLVVAILVIENLNMALYIPVLVIAGTLTGLLIGIAAKFVVIIFISYNYILFII